MISHKHRCIFIHIPRTGGTSVEQWLSGEDWFKIEPQTKHMLASQAKALYADWWDDYFKFSVVRNPWARFVSMAHMFEPEFYGCLKQDDGKISLDKYRRLYPLIEHERRWHLWESLKTSRHRSNQIYGNILDEPINFIAKTETLREDMKYVSKVLGCHEFNHHWGITSKPHSGWRSYFDDRTRSQVAQWCELDLLRFGYEW